MTETYLGYLNVTDGEGGVCRELDGVEGLDVSAARAARQVIAQLQPKVP